MACKLDYGLGASLEYSRYRLGLDTLYARSTGCDEVFRPVFEVP
jgi:hypothetical protein